MPILSWRWWFSELSERQGYTWGFVLAHIPWNLTEKLLFVEGPLSTETEAEAYSVSLRDCPCARPLSRRAETVAGRGAGRGRPEPDRGAFTGYLKFPSLVPCTPSALWLPGPSSQPRFPPSLTVSVHFHLSPAPPPTLGDTSAVLIKSAHSLRSYFAVSRALRRTSAPKSNNS